MHILIATDADWVVNEITAALGDADTRFSVVRNGRHVAPTVAERDPDLVICDLQVGSMGGMAIALELHLDESAGALAHVPIVMLLDRAADVYLAQRSEVEAWLVKPLDALRIRRAATAALNGTTYHEGVPPTVESASTTESSEAGEAGTASESDATDETNHQTPEEQPVPSG